MSRTEELFAADAYLRDFEAEVVAIDPQHGVALNRSAFYPGGGGQPDDRGTLIWDGGEAQVDRTARKDGLVWHRVSGGQGMPDPGTTVQGAIDWSRRHLLMRTHTALHVLCGVIWQDFSVAVTGGNMEPGRGRLDFELDAMSAELGARVETRINQEIARARDVLVQFAERSEADRDPALVRTKANLIPAHIDPLRVIDIVGLDRQADGGTHVASTREVGHVIVTKTESKGRANKRIRLEIGDAKGGGQG